MNKLTMGNLADAIRSMKAMAEDRAAKVELPPFDRAHYPYIHEPYAECPCPECAGCGK